MGRHPLDAEGDVRTFRTHDWSRIQPGLALTCSIGVSVYQATQDGRHDATLKDLIDDADHALLKVKDNGRNGYLVAGDQMPAQAPRLVPRSAPTAPLTIQGRRPRQ